MPDNPGFSLGAQLLCNRLTYECKLEKNQRRALSRLAQLKVRHLHIFNPNNFSHLQKRTLNSQHRVCQCEIREVAVRPQQPRRKPRAISIMVRDREGDCPLFALLRHRESNRDEASGGFPRMNTWAFADSREIPLQRRRNLPALSLIHEEGLCSTQEIAELKSHVRTPLRVPQAYRTPR